MSKHTKTIGPFEVSLGPEHFTLKTKSGVLNLKPAEGEHLQKLLSIVGSMRDMKLLPAVTGNPPFRAFFREDNTISFCRAAQEDVFVTIGWDELDAAISAVEEAINLSLDRRRLKPNPRIGAFAPSAYTGQIFEE